MRTIRLLGSIVLWIAALLGLVAGGVWLAGWLGHVQPMVVISGSMEPGIGTGDLIIGRRLATDQVDVGDVLSLPSSYTGKLVTHRVISIEQLDAESAAAAGRSLDDGPLWEVHMKGDANADADGEAYYVGDTVWTPWIRIPQGGKVVSKVMEPAVAMPIILALVALLGISLLDGHPRKVVRTVVRRMRRDPRVDELDEELAAVGVDVDQLRSMSDLDLKLYALGIDVADGTPSSATIDDAADDERNTHIAAIPSSQTDPAADHHDADERNTHIAGVRSSQAAPAAIATATADERDTHIAAIPSSQADPAMGDGRDQLQVDVDDREDLELEDEDDDGLWGFTLPESDAIHRVRPPKARRPREPEVHEPAPPEPVPHEPSLSG